MATSTVDELAERLEPLTRDPARAAVLCDIDGTLAPIVERPDLARVPDDVSRLIGELGRRYALMACVSGRAAAEARHLVGAHDIVYVGLHGAQLLAAGADRPTMLPAVEDWAESVRRFGASCDTAELRGLGIRIEDKGPIVVFHWRGVPDDEAARVHLEDVAHQAGATGLGTHWGRKVLEIRPPTPIDKGVSVRQLVTATEARVALYAGDDVTDLDAFEALDALVAEGRLDAAVRVGVRSDEGPEEIVTHADLVVDGVPGFARVLRHLLFE